MRASVRRLRRFGAACFFVFIACAFSTAGLGIWMIATQVGFEGGYGPIALAVFLSTFLLTVITGLLVSVANSMMGILTSADND